MKLNIVHYADMQIEVRTSGAGSQRLTEYTHDFRQIESVVESLQPDIVIIPGDVYEHWQANGEEQKIFARHLNNILQHTKRIIIIPGNHDVRQRGIPLDDAVQKRNITDSIDSIVTAVNSKKISYYKETGLYIDSVFDITWAVWSQWTKHSMMDPKPAYSPWDDNSIDDVTTKACIELFHDPIRGARDFTGEPSSHFTNHSIGLDNFRANTIIAGDIHAPDIIWFGDNKERLFTYSSSLTQRNFGEGDYYRNISRFISGNSMHGYNTIVFDIEQNRATECQWHELTHCVSRHTFYLDDKFNYDTMIGALQLDNPTAFNHVRIVCQKNMKAFLEHEQQIIEHFQSKWSCTVHTDFAADVLDIEINSDEFTDLSQVIDKSKILNISKSYIDAIVDKTSTIDSSSKDEAKEYLYSIFDKQLANTELTKSSSKVDITSATISGFMPFSDTVYVNFLRHNITQISGTNGVGKTKIFDFVKWIWSDKISSAQNDRNKKYNYSFYFNDSSDNDTVNGRLEFTVNGDPHVLTKSLTRKWKSGKKDHLADDWVNLLSGTPVVEMTIESKSFTSDNVDEIQDYLDNLLSFNELELIGFVDDVSLPKFTTMSINDLSDIFLNVLGIDVTTTILEQWNDLKENELKDLRKPSVTIDSALQQIGTAQVHIDEINEQKLSIEQRQNELQEQRTVIQRKIDTLRESLHQVDTLDVINTRLSAANEKIAEYDETIATVEATITALNEEKASSSLVEATEKLHAIDKSISEAKVEQERAKSLIDAKGSDIKSAKDTLMIISLEEKDKLTKDINEAKSEVEQLRNDVAELDNQERQLQSDVKDILLAEKDTHNSIINEEQSQIDAIQHDITQLSESKLDIVRSMTKLDNAKANLEQQIEDDTNSKTCTKCNRLHDKSTLDVITKKIDEAQEKLEKISNAIDQYNERTVDIDNDISTKNDLINGHKEQIQTQRSNIDNIEMQITTHINELDPIMFAAQQSTWSSIQKDRQKLIDTINIKQADINRELEQLTEKIKQSPRFVEQSTKLSELTSELEPLRQSHQKCVDNIAILEEQLKSQQQVIQHTKDIDAKIDENISTKTQITKDRDELLLTIKSLSKDSELAVKNVEVLDAIKNETLSMTAIDNQLKTESTELTNIEVKHAQTLKSIEELHLIIDDIKKWKFVDASLKLYKKMLGKNGLPQYIFAHIVPLINSKLNECLSNVDFRLLFNSETLELRFIDLSKNVSRPVQFISGMQKTITGLSIIHVLRLLNHSKQLNVLMIDEISGKVNNGKKLSYEAKNYQNILRDFIVHISSTSRILFVDHVLDFDSIDTGIIEVIPTENGATITQR